MNHDEILQSDSTDHGSGIRVTRRQFLQVAGGGIIILFLGGDLLAQQSRGHSDLPEDFNAFLRIGEDGKVTCFTGKIEMGQGIIASLPQMLADELDVSLDSVEIIMGDTDLCPWDGGTHGSMSTRGFGPHLRAAGAEARGVLLELASKELDSPVEHLAIGDGVVYDKTNSDKRVSYAQLAKGKKITRHMNSSAVLKTPADFKVVGKSALRRDGMDKVTGAAKYAADVRPAGMLYAKILRPPVHGATLKSVDVSGAKGVSRAQVVQDKDLIAVLHEHPDEAERALSMIKADFAVPTLDVDDASIFDHLVKVAPDGEDVSRTGDLKHGEGRASTVFENTYLTSYVAHAPIEPHAAVVRIEGTKATVWASSQSPFGVRDQVAEALGCPKEDVRVISPYLGGGFGGKGGSAQAVEAARLARLVGKPVQVAWTRSEEFFGDTFRPASVIKIRSGITDAGGIAFWDYHVYFAGTRGAEHFYDIADSAIVSHGSGWGGERGSHPFATGAWRAPGNSMNTFARESQIDIMAAKAGADPVEYRLKHLTDNKLRESLTAASKSFGWASAKPSPGRGFGVALGADAGSVVATVVEVEVDRSTGNVQVKRVTCAQDMGLVINPEGAKMQMEGCVTMGMGYALTEEIHFKGGDVLDRTFAAYQLPRFSWLPKIETILIEDRNSAPQGGGEPAIITMGAAIANAIYSATGVRLLQLPMTPDRVLSALKKR